MLTNAFSQVALNYRLGMFGWLGGPKYIEDYGGINLGLEDQRSALDWVSNEIGRFGGGSKM
jgi:cholinesterase